MQKRYQKRVDLIAGWIKQATIWRKRDSEKKAEKFLGVLQRCDHGPDAYHFNGCSCSLDCFVGSLQWIEINFLGGGSLNSGGSCCLFPGGLNKRLQKTKAISTTNGAGRVNQQIRSNKKWRPKNCSKGGNCSWRYSVFIIWNRGPCWWNYSQFN